VTMSECGRRTRLAYALTSSPNRPIALYFHTRVDARVGITRRQKT